MKWLLFLVFSLLVLNLSGASAALQPITVKGSKFFYENGTQFFMKGIAYQADVSTQVTKAKQSYHDPLADVEQCTRDMPYLKELGTNIIRVYAIDPTKDHKQCMKLLDEAGIYVISDLSEPDTSINRNVPSWDDSLYERYTDVIDSLAGFSNVMGFFAGNEVSNMYNNTNASAFVKAAVRDMRAYIKAKGYRSIPVGYATNDDEDIRAPIADYFNCGNEEDRAEFWGYNIYSWCGDSSYTKSGYDKRTEEFRNYSIPVFFAEYGCNTPSPRKFSDVPVLYSEPMTRVFSGGIVYMYHQEENKYGLVDTSNRKVTKLTDFTNLKNQILKVSPKGVTIDSYDPSNTSPRDCPTEGEFWGASTTLPPTPDAELCRCMVESLECVAKGNVTEEAMGELFNFVCGEAVVDCSGITANGTTGQYGAFSMCSTSERLSWVLDAYYVANNKNSKACDFNGNASRQSSSIDDDCKSALDRASSPPRPTSSKTADNRSTASFIMPLNSRFWVVSSVLLASVFAEAVTVFV